MTCASYHDPLMALGRHRMNFMWWCLNLGFSLYKLESHQDLLWHYSGGGGVVPKSLSCVWLLQPHGLRPHYVPLSTEFSRQEHWSGLPFPSPEDLPDPGIKPGFSALRSDSLPTELPQKLWYYSVLKSAMCISYDSLFTELFHMRFLCIL